MPVATPARYAQDSLRCAAAKPNEHLVSSARAGWTSLLLDLHKASGSSDVFETHPTPDITLVVALRGCHRIEVAKGGRWRSAVYQAGAAGLTASMETSRLRWSNLPAAGCFETAHIYLPVALLLETADEYRRIGMRPQVDALSTLVLRDRTVMAVATSLVRGIAAGLPDLYAEQAARWLATHLLARQAGRPSVDEDLRRSEPIADRRLVRVLDYMSAHLAEPLGLAELAREAGMSVHHFGRRFRERLGMTPLAYVIDLRMDEAHRLLRTTDLAISEIAAACGYGRPAAFSAAFHRRFGRTPREARFRSEDSSPDRET